MHTACCPDFCSMNAPFLCIFSFCQICLLSYFVVSLLNLFIELLLLHLIWNLFYHLVEVFLSNIFLLLLFSSQYFTCIFCWSREASVLFLTSDFILFFFFTETPNFSGVLSTLHFHFMHVCAMYHENRFHFCLRCMWQTCMCSLTCTCGHKWVVVILHPLSSKLQQANEPREVTWELWFSCVLICLFQLFLSLCHLWVKLVLISF